MRANRLHVRRAAFELLLFAFAAAISGQASLADERMTPSGNDGAFEHRDGFATLNEK